MSDMFNFEVPTDDPDTRLKFGSKPMVPRSAVPFN